MPIYEYNCPECSEIFEEWVKNSVESDFALCPKCNANAPRMISPTTFILKGGGWYATDYANSSTKKATEKTTEKESPPAASDSSKTECSKTG